MLLDVHKVQPFLAKGSWVQDLLSWAQQVSQSKAYGLGDQLKECPSYFG
jgi:hypothetical protein